jgi:predicted nucleic acid-binding protein
VSAAFFDTNLVVYAVDPRESETDKRLASRRLLAARRVHISTQVMMETYNVLVRKRLASREIAAAYIGRLSTYSVMAPEVDDVLRAIDYSHRYQINHFDALHVCAAERAKLDVFYSEDLAHGQSYGSVRACNPFIEDFLA